MDPGNSSFGTTRLLPRQSAQAIYPDRLAACNSIPERIVDKPYLAGLGKHRPSDSGRNPYTPDAHRTRFGVYKPSACSLFRSFASQQRFKFKFANSTSRSSSGAKTWVSFPSLVGC